MAFAPRGNTVVFPAAAAFSSSGAKHIGAGSQIRVHNSSNSVAWILVASTESDANAAAISTGASPTTAFSMEPGSVEVFQHPLGNNNTGSWVNVCTPTDVTGTSSVNVTPGSGE